MILSFIVLVLVFAGISVILYNGLISKKNQVDNAFASIDALLKKRHDLIPNLVASVQTYMGYEKGLLTNITELRTKALSETVSPTEKAQWEGKISQALGQIMVAVENYPDLKANQNFLQLQAVLNEVEEQISAARRAFNAAVTDYNNALEMFPTNFMASMMGYQPKHVLETPAVERKNVDVAALFK